MITERMTLQEMEADLAADNEAILNYIEKLKVKFRRIVIKSSKFPVCIYKEYTSKRKNRWIIILISNSKKDLGDLIQIRYFSYYNTDRGWYVAYTTSPFGAKRYSENLPQRRFHGQRRDF